MCMKNMTTRRSFGDRNRQRDDEIEGTKINVADSPREREQEENAARSSSKLWVMRGHLLVGRDGPSRRQIRSENAKHWRDGVAPCQSLSSSVSGEIQKGKQKNPDDIDKVPIQTDHLDRNVMPAGKFSAASENREDD